MTDAPTGGAVVRSAVAADLGRLTRIEAAAGELFRSVGLPEVADDELRADVVLEAMEQQRAWVLEVDEVVAGYVLAEVVDGLAHVAQVSVDPRCSRRGHGARLVRRVEEWGRAAGRPATTLTTFTDVPWNGPYYRRLGYVVIPGPRVGPELAALMAAEARMPGLDRSPRCAMVRTGRG